MSQRLIGGHISLINELRKLTVMFARFTSLKSQDEARQLYQKAMKGSLDIVRVRSFFFFCILPAH